MLITLFQDYKYTGLKNLCLLLSMLFKKKENHINIKFTLKKALKIFRRARNLLVVPLIDYKNS